MNYTDLVFAHANEEKLIAMATRLGFQTLILCYPVNAPHLAQQQTEIERLQTPQLALVFAILVENQGEIPKAQRYTKELVANGQLWAFEDKRIRYIVDFESGRREDFIHHRNAGLTQVSIAKAMQTQKTLLVNAQQLLDAQKEQYIILGRMLQNNRLFRKYKPNVIAISGATEALEMRAPRDLENVLLL